MRDVMYLLVFLSGSVKPHNLTERRSAIVSGTVDHGNTWECWLHTTTLLHHQTNSTCKKLTSSNHIFLVNIQYKIHQLSI